MHSNLLTWRNVFFSSSFGPDCRDLLLSTFPYRPLPKSIPSHGRRMSDTIPGWPPFFLFPSQGCRFKVLLIGFGRGSPLSSNMARDCKLRLSCFPLIMTYSSHIPVRALSDLCEGILGITGCLMSPRLACFLWYLQRWTIRLVPGCENGDYIFCEWPIGWSLGRSNRLAPLKK